MVHHTSIGKYSGNLAELAEDIGNLKYDALAEFLHLLSTKIADDAVKDQARGRIRLASALNGCAAQLSKAKVNIEQAWDISEPFMREGPSDKTDQH